MNTVSQAEHINMPRRKCNTEEISQKKNSGIGESYAARRMISSVTGPAACPPAWTYVGDEADAVDVALQGRLPDAQFD